MRSTLQEKIRMNELYYRGVSSWRMLWRLGSQRKTLIPEFRMYSNWLKSEDGNVPEGRGRPSATELDEVEDTTKNKTQMDSLS